ncbi:MAG TPA: peptidoglycan-binding protein [Pyrinomonadaceae bacterium]|jgi:peptidoglycan hydrolase-like protein with peptidoglycan-binding domain
MSTRVDFASAGGDARNIEAINSLVDLLNRGSVDESTTENPSAFLAERDSKTMDLFLDGFNTRARLMFRELNRSGATTTRRTTTVALRDTPPTYDGSRPAPGTTKRPWVTLDAPAQGDPSRRNRATYDNVINQFAVEHNSRYTRNQQGKGETYCNIFVSDVTRAMGAEIPHRVDARGNPLASGGTELDANATNNWLHRHGGRHGWRQVTAEEAQRLANEGHPAIASWRNPRGIGHIAVVRPGEMNANGPTIAQAGSVNDNHTHVRNTFGNARVEYWVNDGGEVRGGNDTPPTPTEPPVVPNTPNNPTALTAPNAQLRRGARGEQVRQLQTALVELGYMKQSEMNTGPGIFGPLTQDSVQQFQREHGINASGIYGPRTRAALQDELNRINRAPASDLERGDRGLEVRRLQLALVHLGHMSRAEMQTGPGIFGPLTEGALREFQQKHRLEVDGIYGSQSRAALERALGSRTERNDDPPRVEPTQPTPPSDAVARLNRMLRGSGLEGKGELMLRLAERYDVPVELALAMFRKEAQWNTTGVAPRNNNPGNIRFVGQQGAVRGAGGFARWQTVDEGIEAYFKLLGGSAYRQFVDARDWRGLIYKYAPPTENDSQLYLNQITNWMSQYRREIFGN